jgi:RecB family endonuclease NucS
MVYSSAYEDQDMKRIFHWNRLIVTENRDQVFIIQQHGYDDFNWMPDQESLDKYIAFMNRVAAPFYYTVYQWDGTQYVEV